MAELRPALSHPRLTFVAPAAKITAHRRPSTPPSSTTCQTPSSSTNTKFRVLTRVAFGFANPEALIALAMLSLGGYRPDLPGHAEK